MTATRILVNLQNVNKSEDRPNPASFTQSVIEHFGTTGDNVTEVNAYLQDNKLILSNDWTKGQPVKLKRPSFCPITNLTSPIRDDLPDDTKSRGIDSGVALILESADGKVLLTRRAKTLRTFPGVWVPPGGHLEENETFAMAGLRECHEETGLKMSPQQFVSEDLKVLALWESVYPTKLTIGPPKRHHIVVYLYGKLKPGFDANTMNKQLQLEPLETDACAWLDRDLVKRITEADEEKATEHGYKTEESVGKGEYVRGHIIDENNRQVEGNIPLGPLLTVSGAVSDHERVSTGTKFALEEWLQRV